MLEGDKDVVLHREPEASRLTLFKVWLLGPLILGSLLSTKAC